MFAKTTLMAAGLAALMSVGGASAQGIQIGPDGVQILPPGYDRDHRYRDQDRRSGISEREAIRIARDVGLRRVSYVDRGRRAFEVNGFDRRAREMTVVVDRRTGAVLDVDRGRR